MYLFLLALAQANDVHSAAELLNQHTSNPLPTLDPGAHKRLRTGRTVTKVELSAGNPHIVGLRVVHAPSARVWSMLDRPDVLVDPSVTEVQIRTEPDGDEIWYGRMDLPLLLSDRQWLVRSTVNRALNRATAGTAFEKSWTETEGAESAAARVPARSAAITVPKNRGSWQVVPLDPSSSLLAYHVQTDLGGDIPGWMVGDVAVARVARALGRVADAAEAP